MRKVLLKISKPNSVLYLKGIPFTQLKAITKFAYFGETEVPEKDLASFVETAQQLQIKGLESLPKQNSLKKDIEIASDVREDTVSEEEI